MNKQIMNSNNEYYGNLLGFGNKGISFLGM